MTTECTLSGIRFIGVLSGDAFDGNGYVEKVLKRMFRKGTSKGTSAPSGTGEMAIGVVVNYTHRGYSYARE